VRLGGLVSEQLPLGGVWTPLSGHQSSATTKKRRRRRRRRKGVE
jgi:hypothetical protein